MVWQCWIVDRLQASVRFHRQPADRGQHWLAYLACRSTPVFFAVTSVDDGHAGRCGDFISRPAAILHAIKLTAVRFRRELQAL